MNEDIKIQYEWVSLLDNSTCSDCEELDSQIFEPGDVPDFPQHAGCRCDLIPIINEGEFDNL